MIGRARLFLAFVLLCLSLPLLAQAVTFPLAVDPERRILTDARGIPFMVNGDAPWLLMLEPDRDQVMVYLRDRQARGFNTLLVELIENHFASNPPRNVHGDKPFESGRDFSAPRSAYFDHAEWVLEQSEKAGMLVLLMPAYLGYGCGEQGWCASMRKAGPAALRGYGEYLAQRFARFDNIIWVHGGDTHAGEHDALAETEAVVAGIRSIDPDSLHSAHCDRYRSAADCYRGDWLDINTTYSGCQRSAADVRRDYERDGKRPFIYLEGAYEGEGASDVCVRSQAYWALLGGAAGHVFGNHPLWSFGDGWQAALETPGARSMAVLGALLAASPWPEMSPDTEHSLVTSGFGMLDAPDYVAAARSRDGSAGLIYLPAGGTVTVDLAQLSGAGIEARWIEPDTGAVVPAGAFLPAGQQQFRAPGPRDWVLRLDARQAHRPGGALPPGNDP